MVAVFLASAVEMVEALTIVVAVGATSGWRTAIRGAVLALVVLAALVAALGPEVLARLPIDALRVVVGALLLVFGLQWLRKAVLRAAGYKAKHDEDAIYAEQVSALAGRDRREGLVVAFKGVLLEGVEVVVVVVSLGSTSHRLGLATVAAAVAVVLVGLIGLVLARQLAGVPENAMKTAVGVMLVSFGTFWSAEGLGVHWPGSDVMLLPLVAWYALCTFACVQLLKTGTRAGARSAPEVDTVG